MADWKDALLAKTEETSPDTAADMMLIVDVSGNVIKKITIDTILAALVDSAPGTLDTLNELAAALGDDANFATTVTNSLAAKAPATPSTNPQTGTSYTLQASDNGKIVTCSNAAAITVTVPSGLGAGFHCQVVQIGAGQVSFAASSTTINNRQSHTKIAGQYGVATIEAYAADTFVLAGDTAA